MSPPPPQNRILISRLSAHGDVVQTLPLVTALKAWDPHCSVGWLVEASAAPLLADHPLIDRLHISERKRWLASWRHPTQWGDSLNGFRRLLQGLREAQYTHSLDVQGLLKSAVLPWLVGIPNRYGNAGAREGAARFYNHCLPPHAHTSTTAPAVCQYLRFAEALRAGSAEAPVPSWNDAAGWRIPPPTSETVSRVNRLLADIPENKPVIALAPGTMWVSKHWHAPYWGRLLKELLDLEVTLILLGGPSESDRVLNEAMTRTLTEAEADRVWNLCGKTELADLYRLFQRVDVLVAPDSAPMHIANAAGRPRIVGLFGPTSPLRTGPLGEGHVSLSTALDCQPCFRKRCPLPAQQCMTEITPAMVLQAVQPLLNARPMGAPHG